MSSPRPPRACPACGTGLAISRLTCHTCGTEVSGSFQPCEFCALNDEERALLRTFLASRGNIKAIERHLGVSYPTARARVDDLLGALDLGSDEPQELEVLEALARGEITVDEALDRLH